MSIESEVQDLIASWSHCCGQPDHWCYETYRPHFDHLILETRAAMPCYGDSDPDCHEEFTRVNGEKVPAKAECPSCKARMALKVTA